MTPTITKTNSATLFIPDVQAEDTPPQFIEEVGTIIFQSALMQMIVGLSDDEAQQFEYFLRDRVAHETFIEEVCAEFPLFEKILDAEMRAFQAEIIS
jgi:hypothetical protein